MSNVSSRRGSASGVAFVSSYPPRRCGVGAFASDLVESFATLAEPAQRALVAAVNDRPEGYAYSERVKLEIRDQSRADYARAAEFLNFSAVDVVCLQHEYDLFGGRGENILGLLRELRHPVVVTCHTVLGEPSPAQKEVLVEVIARSSKAVAISRVAARFLEEVYGVPREKIVHLPHGIPDVPFVDPAYFKDRFGVEGRRVLLTFGLLNDRKGIDTMIEAMPEVVARHPKATYLVLGATHPTVVRREGEAYRVRLQRLVRELGLENNVVFHDRFVEPEELLQYLGAADIYVTPYPDLEQVSSGTLAYAMGAGKAVVSTPYWYAEEMLAEGRGVLVPPGDAAALARAVNGLLGDEVTLAAMRKRAYLHTRSATWLAVAKGYLEVFDEVRRRAPTRALVGRQAARPIVAAELPKPVLDHLLRLSDGTGIAHFARRTLPDWSHGYLLEDAAGAVVAATKHYRQFGTGQALDLVSVLLTLIGTLTTETGVAEGLDYGRRPLGPASDGAIGKALAALGYVVRRGHGQHQSAAYDLFDDLLPHAGAIATPRGAAFAVLGAADYLERFPGATGVRRLLGQLAARLAHATAEPGWVESWGAADWPVAAQAVALAGATLDDAALRARAGELVTTAREITRDGTSFLLRGANPVEEESPVTAASFIEALVACVNLRCGGAFLGPIRAAANWFLGANRRGEALYDFATGGCSDALTAGGLNRNQGAEATIYFVIALLTLLEVACADGGGAEDATC